MNNHLDAYSDLQDLRNEGELVHLDVDECLAKLAEHQVGRLAVNDPKGPLVFPVNYLVEGGTILFRTAIGSKLAAADEHQTVSFQVDRIDLEHQGGWSVLVRGRLVEVTRGDEIDRLHDLPLEPFAGGERQHFVRVMPASVTGRAMKAPAAPADEAPAAPADEAPGSTPVGASGSGVDPPQDRDTT